MKCSVVTVNFSVAHNVKHTCNKEIKGQNKNIIIVDLMRWAVKEAQMQEHRRHGLEKINRKSFTRGQDQVCVSVPLDNETYQSPHHYQAAQADRRTSQYLQIKVMKPF
jgi:hypothetical protein